MTIAYTSGTQVDHYEIIRMLGHGGMNRVYLARDVSNQQEVVLKFPNDDLIGNIAVFERYKREAEIGNRLHHPHVQQLLNTDEKRSEEYLVVEYIKGQTLRAVLEEHASIHCRLPRRSASRYKCVMPWHTAMNKASFIVTLSLRTS